MKQLECNTQLKKLVIFGDWKRKLKVDKDLGMFKCLGGQKHNILSSCIKSKKHKKLEF